MKRLECLDGLRGLLAVYVMISHMAPFAVLPGWIAQPLSHGGAAVDVFFMLSGLVIIGSLEKFHYRAGPFLIARVARIFPVFLVVFAFAMAVHALPPVLDRMTWLPPQSLAYRMWATGWPASWPIDILAHLTMTHGLFPDGVLPHIWVSLLGASWSLSTEWQFYILALVLGRFLTSRGAVPGRLAWCLAGIGVAGLAWALLAPPEWRFSRAFLGNKGHFFALGVASVLVVRGRPGAIGAYAAVLAVTFSVCWWQGGAAKLLPPLVWTLCLAVQVWPVGLLGWASAVLRSRPLQILGALSYGIYLVNEPVQRLFGAVLAPWADGDAVLFSMVWLPGAVVLPTLAAAMLYRWVEVPGQNWGRNLLASAGRDRAGTNDGRMEEPGGRPRENACGNPPCTVRTGQAALLPEQSGERRCWAACLPTSSSPALCRGPRPARTVAIRKMPPVPAAIGPRHKAEDDGVGISATSRPFPGSPCHHRKTS